MKDTKYIFVTGGVVSSLGKGIISSSIGRLLQTCGYKVTIQKFDPYINIDPDSPHKVIDLMESQKALSRMGGTMRLGAYPCELVPGSHVKAIYGTDCVRERHRHRYEFNNYFQQDFERAGMLCSGRNPENQLVEIVEIPSLKWFIGTQFHPEYSSTVLNPHPLFKDFIETL